MSDKQTTYKINKMGKESEKQELKIKNYSKKESKKF